jgi:Tfp pilus assembly protein PilF
MRDRTEARLVVAIAIAVAAVFAPALRHGFLTSCDDGTYVVSNPLMRAPLGDAVRGAFTTAPVGAWAPLHLLSHVVDHRLWGSWAGGYVLVNLVLHATNALLVGWLALRLGAPLPAGAAAALLFAVHPVQVESVAWISQRKSVLSLAWMLASLHLWIGFARAPRGRRALPYGLSLAAAAAALLTKAVAVIQPLALALLDVPLGRARRGSGWIADKLPFAVLAAAVAWITVSTKGEVGEAIAVGGHTRAAAAPGAFAYHGGSPFATFLTMLTVLPRYLRLVAWPADLSAVYLPPIRTAVDAEVAASLALAAALAGVAVLLARRAPRLFFWYALFFLGLLPVSQIVPQVTLMNDRYLYVPMVGASGLLGEGLAAALARLRGAWRAAALAAAATVLLALALHARARVPVWRSDLALWTDTVARAPGSPYAWYNLGGVREAAGDDSGALEAYRRAIAIDPRDADAAVNAGAILLRRGDLAGAAPLLEAGARELPAAVEAQFNLGLVRFLDGRFGPAADALRLAASLDPGACPPATLLGHALVLSGRPAEALERYGAPPARDCSDAETDLYRALALADLGNLEAARGALDVTIPAAARLGAPFLQRPTVKVLRAQPRFEELMRRYASGRRGAIGTSSRPP